MIELFREGDVLVQGGKMNPETTSALYRLTGDEFAADWLDNIGMFILRRGNGPEVAVNLADNVLHTHSQPTPTFSSLSHDFSVLWEGQHVNRLYLVTGTERNAFFYVTSEGRSCVVPAPKQ